MKYSHSSGKTTFNGVPKSANMNAFIYGTPRSGSRICGSKKVRTKSRRGGKLPK